MTRLRFSLFVWEARSMASLRHYLSFQLPPSCSLYTPAANPNHWFVGAGFFFQCCRHASNERQCHAAHPSLAPSLRFCKCRLRVCATPLFLSGTTTRRESQDPFSVSVCLFDIHYITPIFRNNKRPHYLVLLFFERVYPLLEFW